MQNNPFKQNPGSHPVYKDHSSGGKWKADNSDRKFSKKEKEWGNKKFTPVVRAQPATPWATFKNQIIQKQQEEANASKDLNMGSEKAKQFLKKREENYRRMQIIEAKKEDVLWEDFSEDAQPRQNNNQKKSKNHCNGKIKPKIEKPRKFKNSKMPTQLVDKSLLKNFDSKKLSFKQNNSIRKLITRNTYFLKGTLDAAVQDLQRRGLKREASTN